MVQVRILAAEQTCHRGRDHAGRAVAEVARMPNGIAD
jgi:hypothetical protein